MEEMKDVIEYAKKSFPVIANILGSLFRSFFMAIGCIILKGLNFIKWKILYRGYH